MVLGVYCRSPEVQLQEWHAGQQSVFYRSRFSVGLLLLVLMLLLQMLFAKLQGYRHIKWAVGSSQPCKDSTGLFAYVQSQS